MSDAATPVLPDAGTQAGTTYKANIDAGFAVADRLAWAFAPHQQTIPDMTVRVDAGALFDGTALSEIAAQSTGTITAPSVDPRLDRVVIDRSSGAVSVVTGTEAPSPSPPAIPAGKVPIARILLGTATTQIGNVNITDERALTLLGHPITTRGDVIRGDANGNPERLAVGTADQVLTTDGADVLWGPAPGFAAGTKMLFQQTAAPTGWTKDTTHNDKALRVVTGTAGSGGASSFTSVFGSGKTTGNASPGFASHSHTQQRFTTATANTMDMTSIADKPAATPVSTNMPNTVAAGSGSSHNHTLSLDLQYVDLIIATKD